MRSRWIAQCKLQLQRGMQRVERIAEHSMDPIAGRLDDEASVRFDGLAAERIMTCQRGPHALGLLIPQPRASLDVGEQNGRDSG